jgi:hypothetical protein
VPRSSHDGGASVGQQSHTSHTSPRANAAGPPPSSWQQQQQQHMHPADYVDGSQHSFHSSVAGSTAAAAAVPQAPLWPAGPPQQYNEQYNVGPQQYNQQYDHGGAPQYAEQYNAGHQQYNADSQYGTAYSASDAGQGCAGGPNPYNRSSYSSSHHAAAAPGDGLHYPHGSDHHYQQLQQQQHAASSPRSSTLSQGFGHTGQTLMHTNLAAAAAAAAAAGYQATSLGLRPIATSSCSQSEGGVDGGTVASSRTAHTAQGSVGGGSSTTAGTRQGVSRKGGGGLRRVLGAVKYMVAYDPDKC